MDISPTSVAAVICQALSPELSQEAYGITVFAPPGGCLIRRASRVPGSPPGFASPAPAAPRASTQRFMFPMGGFRRHFPFVTPAVTHQVVCVGIFRECVLIAWTSGCARQLSGTATAASHCCNVGGTQP